MSENTADAKSLKLAELESTDSDLLSSVNSLDDGDTLVEPDVPDTEPDPSEALEIATGRPKTSKKKPSAISGRKFKKRELVKIDNLRPSLADRIRADYPDLPQDAKISRNELARYRMIYVEDLLQQEHGEFTELDRQVAESISTGPLAKSSRIIWPPSAAAGHS